MKIINTPEELFWRKVNKDTLNGCWEWTGALTTWGYGTATIKQKQYASHRLSAKWAGLDIDDKVVCHHCDNPKCVNPDHLFVGTQKDNMQDKMQKKRQVFKSRLSYQELNEIKTSTDSLSKLSKKYNISISRAWQIKKH